jgi:transposase-like protein
MQLKVLRLGLCRKLLLVFVIVQAVAGARDPSLFTKMKIAQSLSNVPEATIEDLRAFMPSPSTVFKKEVLKELEETTGALAQTETLPAPSPAPAVSTSGRKHPNVEAIVAAYETEGISVENIAQMFDWEPALVKIILAQKSKLYRVSENVNTDGSKFEIVSDAAFDEIKNAFLTMVKDENVLKPADRAKNMRWLLDEKKGRNDAIKTAPVTNNIVSLNQFIKSNREKYEKRIGALRGTREAIEA